MKNKYLIWGTGKRAKTIYQYFIKLKLDNKPDVIAFVDSNEKKQGIQFEGLPVISPSQIKNFDYDYISIASTYKDEIISCIRKLGIQDIKVKDILEEYWLDIAKYDENIPVSDCPLSIVAIMKDFEEGIEEWLEYYLMLGVSHFYIYDNESNSIFRKKIEKYILKGIVTYNFIEGKRVQIQAYNHAICNYKYETKYMAFIDDDEFIVPIEDKLLPDVIEEIIEKNKKKLLLNGLKIGGIGVNWRVYGTSFYEKKQKGLIIENYVYRAKENENYNKMTKTICNPRTVEHFDVGNPHGCIYKGGYCCINERGIIIPFGECEDNSCNIIRINHYRSKSEEEIMEKFKRGWGVTDSNIRKEELTYNLDYIRKNHNVEKDTIMHRYIPTLKQKLLNNNIL